MGFLEVNDLKVSYGAIKAVKGISFHIEKGEIVSLLGANGAGKSTIMKTIAGLVKANSGKIYFDGENITNSSPDKVVRSGITLSPEGRQIFPSMTVLQNLMLGAYTIHKSKAKIENGLDQAFTLFPCLKERMNQMGGTLSGGEQQMLSIARALMSQPKLLMLDEPSLGLAPILVQNVFELVKRINGLGTTLLLVEQNARMALSISDRAYVIETGNIVLSDSGNNLMSNDKVRLAYLGGL